MIASSRICCVLRDWLPSAFSILQLSDNGKVSDLTPKTKIFGNFIVPTGDVTDDDLVISYLNPGC